MEEINRQTEKLAKARELILTGAIDASDYRTMKGECEQKIIHIEAKLTEATNSLTQVSIDTLLDKAINTLSHIDDLYIAADVAHKRLIVGSIFKEKLCFDGNDFRTASLNEATQSIYQINNELNIKKLESEPKFSTFQ